MLLSGSSYFYSSIKIIHSFLVGFYNYPERHLVLLRTLAAELGENIFTRPWDNMTSSGDLTIEMMDRTGKNLLILYNNQNAVEGKTFY